MGLLFIGTPGTTCSSLDPDSRFSVDACIVLKYIKGKVHPKNMLFSDVRSDKIGKNAIDRFSISPLVLKIFAFKVEKLVIWRQPS